MTTTKILFAELTDLHAQLGLDAPSTSLLKQAKTKIEALIAEARTRLPVAAEVKVGGRMKQYYSTGIAATTKLSPQMKALVTAAQSFGEDAFDLRQLGYKAKELGLLDTVREPYHLAHKNKVELIERGFIRHSTDAEREHRRFMAHRMISVRQKEI